METPFPPFEPPDPGSDARRNRGSRRRRIPFRIIAPNVVTVMTICAGLTAIRLGFEGRYGLAITAIAIAALLDALDGRLARALKSTSRFGAELDSLADFVNFGVAPGIILYFWNLHALKSFGWLAVLIFAIATALRLARFNAMLEAPDTPRWHADYFTGIPAPAGALVVMLPIYLTYMGLPPWSGSVWVSSVYVVFVGLLLVSRLPSYSGKRLGRWVDRDWVAPLFIAAVVLIVLLLSFPWVMASAFTLIYLASLPVAHRTFRTRERRHRAAKSPRSS